MRTQKSKKQNKTGKNCNQENAFDGGDDGPFKIIVSFQ